MIRLFSDEKCTRLADFQNVALLIPIRANTLAITIKQHILILICILFHSLTAIGVVELTVVMIGSLTLDVGDGSPS